MRSACISNSMFSFSWLGHLWCAGTSTGAAAIIYGSVAAKALADRAVLRPRSSWTDVASAMSEVPGSVAAPVVVSWSLPPLLLSLSLQTLHPELPKWFTRRRMWMQTHKGGLILASSTVNQNYSFHDFIYIKLYLWSLLLITITLTFMILFA